jgi:hypothetical protein
MGASTGLILTAGMITFGNEWLQGGGPNWKVGIATLGAAVVFAGLEKLDEPAAVGLAAIAVLTVLIGGINPRFKSPAQEVLSLLNAPPTAAAAPARKAVR